MFFSDHRFDVRFARSGLEPSQSNDVLPTWLSMIERKSSSRPVVRCTADRGWRASDSRGVLPRQQHLAAVGGDHGGMEIRGWVDVVQLARLEDRVETRRYFGATTRLRAVVILAPDDRATDGALGRVVMSGMPASSTKRVSRSQIPSV
jgi:hypothetical protein